MAIPYNPAAGQFSLRSAFTPVSVTQAADNAETLASRGYEIQNQQDERADKEALQAYLREGGSLFDQAGIDKAASALKGKVSSKTYMGLVDYGRKFKDWSKSWEDRLIALPGEKIDSIMKQNEFVLMNLENATTAYKTGVEKRLKDRGFADPSQAPANEIEQARKDALTDFNAVKQQQIQTISGQNVVSPDIIKQYAGMSPDDVNLAIARTKFFHDRALVASLEQKNIAAAKKNDLPALIESIRQNPNLGDKDKEALINKITAFGRSGTNANIVSSVNDILTDPILLQHPDLQKRALDKVLAVPGQGAKGTPYPEMNDYQKTAAETMTWDWLLTGHRPSVRSPYYDAVAYRMQQIAAQNNMSVEQLLMQSQDFKTRIQAKAYFERRAININRAENALENELPVLENAMKHIDLSKYPDLSHIELAALRHLGDPNVTVMDQSARVILNEFQGIITGNVGGALNVSDVEQAIREYKEIQTPQQMKAWIDNARNIIQRTKAANEKTRTEWMGSASTALHHRPGQGSDAINAVPPTAPPARTAPAAPTPGAPTAPSPVEPAAPAAPVLTAPTPAAPANAPAPGVKGGDIPPGEVRIRPYGGREEAYDPTANYTVGTKINLKDGRHGVFVGKTPTNPTGVEIIEEDEDPTEGRRD